LAQVIIHAVADRRGMSIKVIDSGLGVDDPENIFEPFISRKKRQGHRLDRLPLNR
jgi:anti-sigma regulatory factor (Ser/Thr protein kinase)